MEKIDKHPGLQLQLIVAGGALLHNYGGFVEDGKLGGFDVDEEIYFVLEGENPTTMAKSTGLALSEFTTAFNQIQPDVVLTIADRFEELAIAIASSYTNIPLAHIEGGEVSGSIDESIRHAITKLSHLHFPATKSAAERIRRLGEPEEAIFPVGATSLDVFNELDLDDLTPVQEKQTTSGVGPVLDLDRDYLVVIHHPVTTEYERNREYVEHTIRAIDDLRIPTVWLWPNMDAGSDGVSKGIRMYREQRSPDFIHFFTSLPIEEYAPLLANTVCIVGNSSSGIRESSYLGVPSVNVGNRQQGRERGANVTDVPHDAQAIKRAVQKQVQHGPYEPEYIYGRGNAAGKIIESISEFDFHVQKRITY